MNKSIFTKLALLSLPLIQTLSLSCSSDNEPKENTGLPLVVEGWIENGEHPCVIVTRAIDLTADVNSFDEFVEKWCKVSVSDGEKRVILTGRVDKNYVPSFVFTSPRITGEIGKTYTLTIETEEETYTAVTTIPSPQPIREARVSECEQSDTLFNISAFIDFREDTGRHFKFFTRVADKESRFYSSFLGTFERDRYNEATGYNVAKGIHQTYSGKFTPYYSHGDKVDIKLCTISQEGFDFWNAYENSVSLSGNMFLSVTKSCPSNIKGAKGYWLGYGSSYFHVEIP